VGGREARLPVTARRVPADTVSPEALRCALRSACADGLPPLPDLTMPAWSEHFAQHGVDLSSSWALIRGPQVIAFVLLTLRRAKRSRITAFGVLPAARGQGAAATLLDVVLTRADARRDQWVELEVPARNRHAMQRVWAQGFKPVCRLYGYQAPPHDGDPPEAACSPIAAAEAIGRLDELDATDPEALPWPVSGAALAMRPALQAWHCDRAQLIFEATGESALTVRSLIDRDPEQCGATQLLRALRAQRPGHTLTTPPVHREDGAARAFDAAGWNRLSHSQWLLRYTLCG